MSSNIEVLRICQHCGTEFTARTTVTKYCGDACAKRAYKARKRAEKVEQSNKETVQVKQQPIEELKAKEFLTVSQVSKLLSCSRQNVYKLINSGKLQATNLLEKKTIIRRSDLDSLFCQMPETGAIPQKQKQELSDWKEAGYFDITECYTLTEVQQNYKISERTVQQLIKRNNIPKIKKGWYVYVPKQVIDELLT